eukprot:406741_1
MDHDHYRKYADQFAISQALWALSFTSHGLVFYRVHLIYVRYLTTSEYLTTMMQSSSDTDKIIINQPKMYRYHVWISNTILVIIIIGAIFLLSSFLFTIPPYYAFGFQILMGLAIALNFARAKVRESIGCVQESWFTVIAVLMMLLLSSVSPIVFAHSEEQHRIFQMCAGDTMQVIVATMVLYVPIRLLHKERSGSTGFVTRLSLQTTSSSSSAPAIAPKRMDMTKTDHTFLQTFLED